MPFNGTGTFSLVAGNPVVTGTNISSTVQNNTMSDVATALTNCVTRDGQSPATSNIPMGGFKLTGLAAATTAGDAVRYEQALLTADLASTANASLGDAMAGVFRTVGGAVATTQHVVNEARQYNFKSDFAAVAGGVTSNATQFAAAMSGILAAGGGTLALTSETFHSASGLSQPWPVNLTGQGPAHEAFYLGGQVKGSVLTIAGSAAGDCLTIGGNDGARGNFGVSDLSIYASGANAIRSIVRLAGVLHPVMRDVEISNLTAARNLGIGLNILPDTSGNLTLYGYFSHLKIVGCYTALQIEEDSNANTFNACSFQARRYALRMSGTLTPLGNTFNGCSLEGSYSTAMEHEYLAPGANIVGYPVNTAGLYAVKLAKIERAQSTMFSGGYAELGGTPATYNDGVNGVKTLVPVIEVGTNAVDTIFSGMRLACFVLDRGTGTRIFGLQSGQADYTTKHLPTSLRRSSVATSLGVATFTAIPFATALVEDTEYFTWGGGNTVCTVAHPGTYKVIAEVTTGAIASASARNRLRITMGGQTFMGPNNETFAAATEVGLTCTAELVLDAGDTIAVHGYTTITSALLADSTYNRITITKQ